MVIKMSQSSPIPGHSGTPCRVQWDMFGNIWTPFIILLNPEKNIGNDKTFEKINFIKLFIKLQKELLQDLYKLKYKQD
jgi:hypothetical protein